MKKSILLVFLCFFLSMAICAQEEINITLVNGSKAELQTKEQLQRLLRHYDLSKWIFTKSISIDENAIPHSHPVLTLHTRHLKDDELLLATFVHEQAHWFVIKDQKRLEVALKDFKEMFPKAPVGFPEGANDESSTYLHIPVIYLEYRAIRELLGELKAKQVMDFWATDHYTWIYKTVLERPRDIGNIMFRHELVPTAPSASVGQHIAGVGQSSVNTTQTRTYAFINGQWFDGESFKDRTFYTVDGKLTSIRPSKIDVTLDLKGGFVIPPFGDAHTHNLSDRASVKLQIGKYLDEGTFYVQVLTNSQTKAKPIKEILKDTSLDVVYANGGLTSTLGHPFLAFEPDAMGLSGGWWLHIQKLDEIKKSRLAENDGYWFFDSVGDVDAKWDSYVKGKPDIVKIYLLDAENQSKNSVNDKVSLKGLSPEVAEYLVKKAHESGLRVFAHIETANDLRLGIKIGVDGFAHLPGYGFEWSDTPEAAKKFDPTEIDLREIAKKRIIVIPTLSLSSMYSYKRKSDGTTELDKARNKKLLIRQKRLLKMLLENNIRIAFGSDQIDETISKELFHIYENKLLDNLTILKIAVENTPQTIFPDRKIGRLRDGYEASFLALKCNPIEKFQCIENIEFRFKQGVPIELQAAQ